MPKKKRANSKSTSVRVGDISDVSGKVNIAGGNITTNESRQGLSPLELKTLFLEISRDIDGMDAPSTLREDVKAEVKEIETTVTEASRKDKKVDEGFIAHRFRNIARMAPDILDMVAAMLVNPLAGLGVAAKKIAEKAKEEVK